mmetsp:Transcript_744/g.1356  ORF Transcript_744/g.1356 Transcript_744/m.1356 type:complete len:250 (-) Transcript_744:1317-2066(-)
MKIRWNACCSCSRSTASVLPGTRTTSLGRIHTCTLSAGNTNSCSSSYCPSSLRSTRSTLSYCCCTSRAYLPQPQTVDLAPSPSKTLSLSSDTNCLSLLRACCSNCWCSSRSQRQNLNCAMHSNARTGCSTTSKSFPTRLPTETLSTVPSCTQTSFSTPAASCFLGMSRSRTETTAPISFRIRSAYSVESHTNGSTLPLPNHATSALHRPARAHPALLRPPSTTKHPTESTLRNTFESASTAHTASSEPL